MSLESPKPSITTDAITQPVHLLLVGTLRIRITADSQHVLCQRLFCDFLPKSGESLPCKEMRLMATVFIRLAGDLMTG